MENINTINFQKLTEKVSKAVQGVMQNYMDSQADDTLDITKITHAYSVLGEKLVEDPKEFDKVKSLYLKFHNKQQALVKLLAEKQFNPNQKSEPIISPEPGDKRFKAQEWDDAPYFYDFIKQNYLLVSQLMDEVVTTVETDYVTKKRLKFYNKEYTNALSPGNYPLTNPEVMKLAVETKGQSLIDGFQNFIADVEKGRIAQSDEKAFEVGRNLACTPGSVVYENELMQLIQYSPTTKKIGEIPMLIIPACINKYYLLDMQPHNSLAKYIVGEGITAFMISWKNGGSELKHIVFDDYVEQGVIQAIDVIKNITKSKKVNTLGNCLGGTILATAISILSGRYSKKENPINSASFLACMIDFSDIGPVSDLLNHDLLLKLENGKVSEDGYLRGDLIERLFNIIRSNDLIWRFIINNYLKGEDTPAFDLLYWTNDHLNIPSKMFLYYLENMLLDNKLSRKNALRICDTQIDIGKIEVPTFVIAFTEDHIAPPTSAFATTELVSGDVEYILGGSGHVMGLTNAPEKNKYGYALNGELNRGYEHWKNTSEKFDGSWWPYWSKKVLEISGKQVAAPKKEGSVKYKVLEAAPGKYLKEKMVTVSAKKT